MSDYALDPLVPAAVVAPADVHELADCLRAAAAHGRAVVPWGGGTGQHLLDPPARYDLALSTRKLHRIADYHPADLVVTVEAGATLAALQAELARHGQWLPWEVPQPEHATIGGLLASGAAGALRLSYGPPRDWTLGMAVVLGDGRLIRSGGRVVKNVAGYDSHKLQLGAHGTLGVIVEATFKLAPIPEHRCTVLASFTEPRLTAGALSELLAPPLQPLALAALNQGGEMATPPLHAFLANQPAHIAVAARFAGTSGAVGRQVREAVRRCVAAGARTVELGEEDDRPLWDALAAFPAPTRDGSLLLRAGFPAAAFVVAAGLLERTAIRAGWRPAQLGLAGVGLIHSRWQVQEAAPEAVAAALAAVRAGLRELGGYVVVEELPADLAAALDRWGPPPAGMALMRSLRKAWDPAGILNPGRYLL